MPGATVVVASPDFLRLFLPFPSGLRLMMGFNMVIID
jgi:hypothetical protein